MMRHVLCIAAGIFWLALPSAHAQTEKIQKEVDTALQKKRLENHLAEALKNNPDLRVAEAKLREAEAEANRTRLKVVSDITIVHAEILAAQAALAKAEANFERARKLLPNQAISENEHDAIVQALATAKAELAAKSAKLPYLLGTAASSGEEKSALKILMNQARAEAKAAVSDDEFLRRVTLDLFGRLPTPAEIRQFKALDDKNRRQRWIDALVEIEAEKADARNPSYEQVNRAMRYLAAQTLKDLPIAEKLRTALDTKLTMNGDDMRMKDVFAYIQDKSLKGINLHVRAKGLNEEPITIKLSEPIPLGAFLQFLEDEKGCHFILRDYGIVVISATERPPPGAVRVTEFWKHGKAANSAPDAKQKEGPNEKSSTAAPQTIQGVIERVDQKDPFLVQISIGANADLEKGQMLDVYRLQPQAKYLARVRIVEVQPTKSIGRVTGAIMDPQSAPRPGDHVSKLK
jgi:hypothetical protein